MDACVHAWRFIVTIWALLVQTEIAVFNGCGTLSSNELWRPHVQSVSQSTTPITNLHPDLLAELVDCGHQVEFELCLAQVVAHSSEVLEVTDHGVQGTRVLHLITMS